MATRIRTRPSRDDRGRPISDNAEPRLEIVLTVVVAVVILVAIGWWTAVSLEAGRPGDLWLPWAAAIVLLANCALGIQQARRAIDYDRRMAETDSLAEPR